MKVLIAIDAPDWHGSTHHEDQTRRNALSAALRDIGSSLANNLSSEGELVRPGFRAKFKIVETQHAADAA